MEYGVELLLAVFVIAALYGAVGHGGASGYLAILSLAGVAHPVASSTALLLNLFVAGIALIAYRRAGYFSARLLAPLLITSVPLAFLGGMLKVSTPIYNILLALALFIAAIRMLAPRIGQIRDIDTAPPGLSVNLITGGVLGLVSGIIGVGGGIFLSPLMLMLGWATPRVTSATAAGFIVANSLAGLAGRLAQGNLPTGDFWPLLAVSIAGGWLGSWYGAQKAQNTALCRLLAIVLLIAACKMILQLL